MTPWNSAVAVLSGRDYGVARGASRWAGAQQGWCRGLGWGVGGVLLGLSPFTGPPSSCLLAETASMVLEQMPTRGSVNSRKEHWCEA